MRSLYQHVLYSLMAVVLIYIAMHDKGLPLWVYAGNFILLLGASYLWERTLPPTSEENRSKMVRFSSIAALVLLIGVAIFISL